MWKFYMTAVAMTIQEIYSEVLIVFNILPDVGFETDFGVEEVLGVDLFLLALLGLELIILGPPFLLFLSLAYKYIMMLTV